MTINCIGCLDNLEVEIVYLTLSSVGFLGFTFFFYLGLSQLDLTYLKLDC